MSTNPITAAQALATKGHADEAVSVLRSAGEAGDAAAAMELAVWYLRGQPIARDLPAARACLRQAVSIGHVDAALMEVALTANGSGGPADWARAQDLLRVA